MPPKKRSTSSETSSPLKRKKASRTQEKSSLKPKQKAKSKRIETVKSDNGTITPNSHPEDGDVFCDELEYSTFEHFIEAEKQKTPEKPLKSPSPKKAGPTLIAVPFSIGMENSSDIESQNLEKSRVIENRTKSIKNRSLESSDDDDEKDDEEIAEGTLGLAEWPLDNYYYPAKVLQVRPSGKLRIKYHDDHTKIVRRDQFLTTLDDRFRTAELAPSLILSDANVDEGYVDERIGQQIAHLIPSLNRIVKGEVTSPQTEIFAGGGPDVRMKLANNLTTGNFSWQQYEFINRALSSWYLSSKATEEILDAINMSSYGFHQKGSRFRNFIQDVLVYETIVRLIIMDEVLIPSPLSPPPTQPTSPGNKHSSISHAPQNRRSKISKSSPDQKKRPASVKSKNSYCDSGTSEYPFPPLNDIENPILLEQARQTMLQTNASERKVWAEVVIGRYFEVSGRRAVSKESRGEQDDAVESS
ncbi:hypothetical protein BKA69DRAFT_1124609 [Paraphysoderma sedebokerense]|nr:hypothetical protein BKA69DRAFT_1124609 [Paraphysoderma sedebokerense]